MTVAVTQADVDLYARVYADVYGKDHVHRVIEQAFEQGAWILKEETKNEVTGNEQPTGRTGE